MAVRCTFLILIVTAIAVSTPAFALDTDSEIERIKDKLSSLDPNAADNALDATSDKLMAAEQELLKKIKAEQSEIASDEISGDDSSKMAALAPSKNAKKENSRSEVLTADEISKATTVDFEGLEAKSLSQEKEISSLKNELQAIKLAHKGALTTLSTSSKELQSFKSGKEILDGELKEAKTKIQRLSRELNDTRNRLMVAETEVERLSSQFEARNRSNLTKLGAVAAVNVNRHPPAQQRKQQPVAQPVEEMPIATIIVDKAQLRTGPGKDNSPLMAVTKGTRLAIETRQGEWYRVLAPTGARAWVSSDVVAFGTDGQSSPSGALRIKGYNAQAEDDAFKLIRSGAVAGK